MVCARFCSVFLKSRRYTFSFVRHFCNEQRDVEKLFVRKDVQQLLTDVTHCQLGKIFSRRPVAGLHSPRYLFLTDEDLKMSLEKVKKKAEEKLLMPPVMNPREETLEILEVDTAIQGSGYDTGKYVFTDISLGFSDRERLIVVREPNGVLRRANRRERYRVNQIYYPIEGRTIEVSKMFEDQHLEKVLNRYEYFFVLERICLQFEPDDPIFNKLTQKTYDHIDENGKYDLLRSTRHFGPMAFYFAFNHKIDGLLIDMIDRRLINDGSKLVKLFYILQGREECNANEEDDLAVMKSYIVKDSKRRHYLELSIKNYEDYISEQKSLEDAIETTDGKNIQAIKS